MSVTFFWMSGSKCGWVWLGVGECRSSQLRRLAYCKILLILQALEAMNSQHQLNRYDMMDIFPAKEGCICIKRSM